MILNFIPEHTVDVINVFDLVHVAKNCEYNQGDLQHLLY